MAQITLSVENLGKTLAEFSVKRAWLTIFMCIALVIAGGYGGKNLGFSGDYQIFFGDENPELQIFLDFEATYGKADNISFVVIPKEGDIYQPRVIEAIHDITTKAWRLPFVSRVDSLTNFQHTYAEGDDLIVEDLIFEKSEIAQPGQMERLQRIAENEPLLHEFITASNGTATIINAVLQVDRKIAEDVLGAAQAARDIQAEILEQYPSIDIKLTGASMLSSAFSEVAMQDSATLIPAMYLLITVVMLLVLRSLWATVAGLLIVILSTIFGMGFGGWLSIELTPISVGASTIILTIAIADAVHIIAAMRQKMQRGLEKLPAIVEATATNTFPVTLTSITTAIGFLSLNFSDSPPFHHLGNMAAAGIFMAWILSITFLPAVLTLLPVKYEVLPKDKQNGSVMKSLGAAILRRRYAAFILTAATCAVAISLIPRLEFNDVWSKYFDENIKIRQAIDATRPHFGTDNIEFVIDSSAPQNVLEPVFLQDVKAFSEWLRMQPEVAHVYSVSDIMKRLNKNLNEDKPDFYDIPDNRKLASQYLLVYELSLPYGLDLNDRIDIDRQRTRVTATIRDTSTVEARTLIKNATDWMEKNSQFGATVSPTGNTTLFNYIADRNVQAMFEGGLVLIVAIFIIMTVFFRSAGIGLLSIILNAIPVFVAFGIWAVVSGTVGFSIAAVGAVAIGLVIDYTVHLVSKFMSARRHYGKNNQESILYAFDTAGTAIVATTAILTAGFALLATSAFKPNTDMGLLTAIAIMLAMVINFLIMPGLLSFNSKEKENRL
ncbi:MMPL family transporter [Exilibacterium tricleocarpae]|uniref:MMPL family transporter n=1 Tax=Exilibacterium tricleocarpae TaxID=2591008 RepID=A0A545TNH7_9GAMM|nr:MMPL family transporter [Exilibacterium tricleocarpae]TQV78780.1 MMPL family transporter [Exilibacterium tricleocarpae]